MRLFPRRTVLCLLPILLLTGSVLPAAALDPPVYQFKFGNGILAGPRSIAVQNGEVFVLEYGGRQVTVFDLDGNYLREWGSDGNGDGQFRQTRQITVTPSGKVYVTDEYRHDIQQFTTQGAFVRKWGGLGDADSLLNRPDGITYDADENIWVADRFNDAIKKFDPEGNHLLTISGDNRLIGLTDLVVTSQYIYTTIWSGSYTGMRQWTLDGTFVAQTAASFTAPTGLGQAPDGYLYVAAYAPPNRVYVVDPTTLVLETSFGGYGTEDNQLQQPFDVAVAPSGAIYVAESLAPQVKVFAYTTAVERTTWGRLKAGFGEPILPLPTSTP